MKQYVQLFEDHSAKKSIRDLDSRRDRPMVEGVAKILRDVRDRENRLQIARKQVREFRREGIRFDYSEFYRLCDLG